MLARLSRKFEKRCKARQSETRAGSVLEHVTKRIVAITPHRALVVLRFLLNRFQKAACFWSNPNTYCFLNTDIQSAKTGERFGAEAVKYGVNSSRSFARPIDE